MKFRIDWDWPGAEVEFKRALELKPDFAAVHHNLARLLVLLGGRRKQFRITNRR